MPSAARPPSPRAPLLAAAILSACASDVPAPSTGSDALAASPPRAATSGPEVVGSALRRALSSPSSVPELLGVHPGDRGAPTRWSCAGAPMSVLSIPASLDAPPYGAAVSAGGCAFTVVDGRGGAPEAARRACACELAVRARPSSSGRADAVASLSGDVGESP